MQQSASYRPHAVFMVVASGFVLLFVSAVFQVAVWELRGFYRYNRFGLSGWPKTFLDLFGHRPDAYLMAVILWLWWPMVAALAYCHCRHREPQDFATAFLYWFACCWLLAALVLTFMAALCVYPVLVLMLADLEGSPDYMWVVTVVSWALPVVVLFFATACKMRFRKGAEKKVDEPTPPVKGE
jgi:hypothetical protein